MAGIDWPPRRKRPRSPTADARNISTLPLHFTCLYQVPLCHKLKEEEEDHASQTWIFLVSQVNSCSTLKTFTSATNYSYDDGNREYDVDIYDDKYGHLAVSELVPLAMAKP
ncbi:hypothetical protein Tco_1173545 [Tanacetum coccineum]